MNFRYADTFREVNRLHALLRYRDALVVVVGREERGGGGEEVALFSLSSNQHTSSDPKRRRCPFRWLFDSLYFSTLKKIFLLFVFFSKVFYGNQ